MNIPEQVDLDFLALNQTNPEWADYLVTHWEGVLSNFVHDDYPQACYGMTQILRSRAFSDTVSDRTPYLSAIERLASTGLEMLNQNNEGSYPISEITSYKMDVANLESVRGAALIHLSRFTEAAFMFQQSNRHFNEFADLVVSEGGDNGELLIDIREKVISCRIHTAEAWYGYSRILPADLRRIQLSFVIANLNMAMNEYEDAGDADGADYVRTLLRSPTNALKKLGTPDPRIMHRIESCSYDGSYSSWCSVNHLYFNLGSQMNYPYPDWLNDDCSFRTTEFGAVLMDDIIESFDHCRRQVYGFASMDSRKYEGGRTEQVEGLLDTYARLITLFVKFAKVVSINCGGSENMDFRQICKALKGNGNRYLNAIAGIYDSLFPETEGFGPDPDDPAFKVYQASHYQTFLRDSMVGGALEFLPMGYEQSLENYYCSITTDYLEHVVTTLLRGFREVVFLLELACLE